MYEVSMEETYGDKLYTVKWYFLAILEIRISMHKLCTAAKGLWYRLKEVSDAEKGGRAEAGKSLFRN